MVYAHNEKPIGEWLEYWEYTFVDGKYNCQEVWEFKENGVEDFVYKCGGCDVAFESMGSLNFQIGMSHVARGEKFLTMVEDFFII